jgi:hypothetical protein
VVGWLLVTLCAIAALSGCTAPVVGSAGVGVDQEGRPVGFLAVCDEHIDGATLSSEDPGAPSAGDRSVDAGTWTADTPITSFATWSLNGPQAGWTATLALPELHAHRQYSLHGWTHDNSSSTASVTFAQAQLLGLTFGQVLYHSGYDETAELDVYSTASAREFQTSACSS